MTTLWRFGLPALALLGTAALVNNAGGPLAVETASAAEGSEPTTGERCKITIKGYNGGTVPVKVTRQGVRTRLGTWKNRSYSPAREFRAEGSAWVTNVDLACNARRRWRFDLARGESQKISYYYPSSSDYTQNTTINLGNVGRSSLW